MTEGVRGIFSFVPFLFIYLEKKPNRKLNINTIEQARRPLMTTSKRAGKLLRKTVRSQIFCSLAATAKSPN